MLSQNAYSNPCLLLFYFGKALPSFMNMKTVVELNLYNVVFVTYT